jgi:UDP-N-acetyl-D-mannosaminuronic acid transferase (WecB/TagA/CpsF family)
MDKREYIGGLPVDTIAGPDILRVVSDWLEKPVKSRQIVTLNANMLMMALRNPILRRVISDADLITPDGFGIVKALRHQQCFTRPIAGIDLMRDLLEYAARREASEGLCLRGDGRPAVCAFRGAPRLWRETRARPAAARLRCAPARR